MCVCVCVIPTRNNRANFMKYLSNFYKRLAHHESLFFGETPPNGASVIIQINMIQSFERNAAAAASV